jgi:hypothetical protein
MLVQNGGDSQKGKQEPKEGYVVCHLGKLYHAKYAYVDIMKS